MNLRYITVIFSVLFFFAAQHTFAADGAVSQEEFRKVIHELKNEIKTLKDKNIQLNGKINTLESKEQARQDTDIGDLKEDVEELSELMQTVERKSVLDRIQMNAELRTRCDWFTYRDDKTNHDESVDAIFSNRFRLNLFSKINANLQIHARLVMYHTWNDLSVPSYPRHQEFNRSRVPGETDIKAERVYADYFFKLGEKFPMALSFGRLPTTDGLPTDLRDDTPRKSTYPGLMWDTEVDGIGLSLGLEPLTGLKDSALRFIWARIVEDGDSKVYRRSSYDLNDIDVYFAQFETGFKSMADTIFVISSVYMPDWMTGDMRPLGLKPVDIQGEMGSYWKVCLYFQSKRFMGSDFDIFAGWSYNDYNGNGQDVWGIGPGNLIKINNKLIAGNGTGVHAGFRYNIPWKVLNNAKFGVEYNHGSKYHSGGNWSSEDPLQKLNNRGGGTWDFYYIQPIDKHFKVRVGYTYLQKRYDGLPPLKRVDEKITNGYILLDAKF
ncbi:MAG: DUF3373 family protein [Deltaproteobacteria bacterium]|nr:DUF3373 family protein [Deltaproteobacteria bacterium]